jgi:hypothetical protein
MPLCGFNQEMLDGINSLHEGLVDAILDKTSLEEAEKSSKEEK